MKGRTPTAEERRWMDAAGQLGCIACHHLGVHSPQVSLHHIDGRTKEGAHFKTIPLCHFHHQGGDMRGEFVSVHPWKTRFEERFGTQLELLDLCRQMVKENGNDISFF
jgi:hypothetical protein